jgi:hypothetical protein
MHCRIDIFDNFAYNKDCNEFTFLFDCCVERLHMASPSKCYELKDDKSLQSQVAYCLGAAIYRQASQRQKFLPISVRRILSESTTSIYPYSFSIFQLKGRATDKALNQKLYSL